MPIDNNKRTIVYIDGFNLYYGCLKNTPYKWLDLKLLFDQLLTDNEIVAIKYFTARVTPRDPEDKAADEQKAYLKALEKYRPEVKIYYGHFLDSVTTAKVHKPKEGIPKYVKVHKTEEKGSDVNLALHVLNDAWENAYDCAVIVSNDSDLSEALRLVKHNHNKKVGVIFPILHQDSRRRPSQQLKKYADFIKLIRKHVLENSQLPSPVPESKIYKPKDW